MNVETSALPIRVLVVDDDEDDFTIFRDLIQEIPQQQFQVDWCSDYNSGAKALAHSSHDIYFVDYFLGAKTGIDLLKEGLVHQCKEPIILLTGKGNPKIDREALTLGAFDYLIKSQLSSEILDRCIRYSMQIASTLKGSIISENKFRAIFEKSKDMIFIATPEFEFIHVNRAAVDLLGLAPNELLHSSMRNILAKKTEFDNLILKLNTTKEIIDYPIELITNEKVKKKCILSVSLEVDEIGAPYVQGIIHDISLLKKIEEIKLQSEKLEVKGSFIRTLAHEIRNPLHNIVLSLGLLKNEASKESLELLEVIERNSSRINELINELMDSNQYHKMKLEVTSLTVLINEALAKAADQINLNRIKIKFIPPVSEALALVDREKVKTAFLNIIINAIEAMEIGKGELTISISSSHHHHQVKIKDNGCGLSKKDIGHLFEPYFTTKPNGMGLGLAAAQAILHSLKAEIEASSVLHEGTTFTITFPSM